MCCLCRKSPPTLCVSCINADLSILWARRNKLEEALLQHQAQLFTETSSLARLYSLNEAQSKFKQTLASARARTLQTEAQVRLVRETNAKRKAQIAARRADLIRANAHADTVVAPSVARLVHAAEALEEAVAVERRKRALELHDVLPMVPAAHAGQAGSVAGVAFVPEQRQHGLALQLVARAMMIVADYVKLQLPFRMGMHRGVIRLSRFDDAAEFPLLPWEPSYASAARMLWRNMQALCQAQGVPGNVMSPRDLVSNMWQLFHSPSLGRSVRQALLDAGFREARFPVGSEGEGEDFVML
jgi:hypothetical protein